jgi:hypothetical protein
VTAGGESIEVVRGRLPDELAEEILGFWSSHGALEGEAARQRLADVVCVALDDAGETVGVNSAQADDVSPVGRFWRYRSFLPGGSDELAATMFNAAFEALGEGFDPDAPGPIGLAVKVTATAEMERRAEAVWPAEELFFAGFLEDGAQLRLRYFWNATIGPGLPNSPLLEDTRDEDFPVGDQYRVAPPDEIGITSDDILDLWRREAAVPEAVAQERVHEVQLVAVKGDGDLAGIATAYIERNEWLRMDFWYFRTYVAVAERHSNLAGRLALALRDRLEQRFVDGEDTGAAGIVMEIENEGLRAYFNRALWLPLGLNFIGTNQGGDHVRVRYFPGVHVPVPTSHSESQPGDTIEPAS